MLRLEAEALAPLENRVLGVSAASGGGPSVVLGDHSALTKSHVWGFVVLQRVDVVTKQVMPYCSQVHAELWPWSNSSALQSVCTWSTYFAICLHLEYLFFMHFSCAFPQE